MTYAAAEEYPPKVLEEFGGNRELTLNYYDRHHTLH
jgi:hypothetical protein